MQTGALPAWETSASGPLRPLPAGLRAVEYVESTGAHQYVDTGLNADGSLSYDVTVSWTSTWVRTAQWPMGAWKNNSPYVRHYFGKTAATLAIWAETGSVRKASASFSANDGSIHRFIADRTTGTYSIDGVASTSASAGFDIKRNFWLFARNGATPTYAAARIYQAKFWRGQKLVRDYAPMKDAAGVGCLYDRVGGLVYYSAAEAPLVAGPEVEPEYITPQPLPALSAAPRNWYAGALRVPAGPAAPDGSVVCDALVLPEGNHSAESNRIVVAEAPMIRAIVGRYRSGLAPVNIPVRLAHGGAAVGRVVKLWAVAGSGLWARLRVPASVATSAGAYCSAEALCLRATARDDWGAWGTFLIPWRLTGVALVDDPALAGTRWTESHLPDADYPDPRTIDNLPILP